LPYVPQVVAIKQKHILCLFTYDFLGLNETKILISLLHVMFMTKRNEDILSNLPVRREFHNIFLGGVHAGAITVIWALEELAWNPRTMKKAQDEIRNSVGKKGRLAEESIDELHPGNKRNSEMATLLLHYFSQEKPCLTVKSMVITFTPKY
jgi:hypothetical protein